jgi:hypothetical protein
MKKKKKIIKENNPPKKNIENYEEGEYCGIDFHGNGNTIIFRK